MTPHPSSNEEQQQMDNDQVTVPIYHICEKHVWEQALDAQQTYFPPTFEEDGRKTHAGMDPNRLLDSANHFYKQSKCSDWICLQIDPMVLFQKAGLRTLLESPLAVGTTAAEKTSRKFPHIYGGIPTTIPNLVTDIYPMTRAVDGTFLFIQGLSDKKTNRG